MGRRFVNLVVQGARGLYSLRRIPANRLFYPSTRAAEEATAKSQESFRAYVEEHGGRKHPGLHTMEMLEKLPRSTFAFEPAPVDRYHLRGLDFACVLGDESKILSADNRGNTVVFDADYSSVLTFPNLISSKRYNAISLSIINNNGNNSNDGCEPPPEDGLYVMTRSPDPSIKNGCFEVLNYSSRDDFREMTPYWLSLPPPPFANYPDADITSYTVVDGSTIYISSSKSEATYATYAFDTVSREWRRLGSWTMPFVGKAEYVPELNLWFGLSARHPYSLCAFDLLSNSDAANPPTVQHTWVDLDIPRSWLPWNIHLINLGCGKFCIAKMFRSIAADRGSGCSSSSDNDTIDSDPIYTNFAVFTGLHMVRGHGKGNDDQGGVRMIKHKSMYYQSFDDYIEWVI
uniref:F-box associated domain-containing protein n=1 Tax=Oryza punctata TaxID=4537 RepID=A0A0E0MBN9_ORYPU